MTAWRNWAGNQTMSPAEVVSPSGVDELQAVVTSAAVQGRRVKAIGSGHSFSGIGLTDGVLVRLDDHDRLLEVDTARHRVTVQAGMPLHRLNAQLAAHGLGLTNMGDIDRQTVAGALSTGTHGTGRDSGGLATQVVGLELVLADGEVLRLGEDDDLLPAARVGLGALGLLSAVTLQAEPAFLLRAEERPEPLDDVLDGFEERVAAAEHVELYWFPHTSTALTKRNTRSPGPAAPVSPLRHLVEDELLSNVVFEATCRLGRAVPRAVPTLNRVASRALSARSYVDAAPRVFTSPRRVRFVEMEYAVPREALPDLLRALRRAVDRDGLRIGFPVEVRVAPADDAWLSTAYGRDTAYVAAHLYRGVDPTAWFDALEGLAGEVGGRPHWGKVHRLGAPELAGRYPRFADFLAVRDRLDPERRFTNSSLDAVLGP